MKIRFYSIILALIIVTGCGRKNEEQTASVKVFNAMSEKMSLEFREKNVHTPSKSLELDPLEASEYNTLPGAVYEINVKTNSKELLQKKLGFAAGEKYSAIIYGNPEFSSHKNENTFSHKLHYIFEGSENYTKNGFLPGDMVFRDKIKLKKGASSIRVFNAAVGSSPINLELKDGDKTKKIAKKLAYAKPVLSNTIKSGQKTLELYLAGAPDPLIKKDFNFQSKKAYIIIVVNEKENLGLRILEN